MNSQLMTSRILLILILLVIVLPITVLGQSRQAEVDQLHAKIDKLSKTLDQFKAEKHHASNVDEAFSTTPKNHSRSDSLQLLSLRRKQAESRMRIDALTMDIIRLSQQLQDPKKRYALAKKMKQPKPQKNTDKIQRQLEKQDSTKTLDTVSARNIDLAAVKLVRTGKSLDQARLLTIDQLTDDQVLGFYRGLDKNSRYKLYDIADDILKDEDGEMINARRSAIYFYLFTK